MPDRAGGQQTGEVQQRLLAVGLLRVRQQVALQRRGDLAALEPHAGRYRRIGPEELVEQSVQQQPVVFPVGRCQGGSLLDREMLRRTAARCFGAGDLRSY